MLPAFPHGNLSHCEVTLTETAQLPACTPCMLCVRMSFQISDVLTCFRIHHHAVPGFSFFFFNCMLQWLVVDEHIDLLILLEQLRKIVLRIGALTIVAMSTSAGDQRNQSYLRLIT